MKLSIYCCKQLILANPYMAFTDCNTLEEFLERKKFIDLTITNGNRVHNRDGRFDYKLFLKNNEPKNPKWWSFIFDGVIGESRRENPITKSCSGIILVKCSVAERVKKIFIIGFGSGGTYIDEASIKENFGLKVVLNSMSIHNLHLIDKKNIGSNTRQVKEGFSNPTNVKNFDINKFIDKLTFVEGCPEKEDRPRLGKKIGGRDAVLVDMQTSFNNLGVLCKTYYQCSLGDNYSIKGFGFIDNYTSKIDTVIIQQLNDILRNAIRNDRGNISLSPKDIIQMIEQIEQFEVSIGSHTQSFNILNYEEIYQFIQGGGITSLDQFEEKVKIQGQDGDGNPLTTKTSFKKYIIFEATLEDKQYILHEGTRYEVKQDYYSQIQVKIASMQVHKVLDNTNYLHFDKTIDRAHGKISEGAYNIRQGATANFFCIDKGLFRGYDSGIEVGDLIYSEDNDCHLIHIKRYSSSAALSHLFAQGRVSHEALKSDNDYYNFFTSSFNSGFPVGHLPNNKNDIKITFGIIGEINTLNKLPFFSKINLINTVQEIEKLHGIVKFVFITPTREEVNN